MLAIMQSIPSIVHICIPWVLHRWALSMGSNMTGTMTKRKPINSRGLVQSSVFHRWSPALQHTLDNTPKRITHACYLEADAVSDMSERYVCVSWPTPCLQGRMWHCRSGASHGGMIPNWHRTTRLSSGLKGRMAWCCEANV